MINDSVKAALSSPGLYVLTAKGLPAAGVAFVEVDSEGRAHQLSPETLTRNGELLPGGWYPEAVLTETCFVRF